MRWSSGSFRVADAPRNVLPLMLVTTVVCGPLSVCGLSNSRFAATAVDARQDESAATSETTSGAGSDESEHRSQLLRGRVVWLAQALEDEFGISTVPEVSENALALLTTDGELLPIVENVRGRAFRKDKRLRDMDVELLVRRYDKQPLIQILRVYEIDDGKRFEVDYWCDICAITMFETGPCACCQDDNVLRKRPAEEEPLP